ncbi:LCP family protein [Goekera deserti]|uniref:LCP family protein n=1 Tax=Goekera deserti TaxID=2497753 RepID=UPI001F2ACAA8|nr:LCP family protein [Goekera deserti]
MDERDGRQEPTDGRRLPPRLDPRAGRPSRRDAEPAARAGGERAAHGAPRHGGAQRPPRTAAARAALVARVVAAVMSLVLLGTGGWGWYLARVAEASLARTDAIPADGNTESDEAAAAGEATNLLLVGNDSRSGISAEQAQQYSTGIDSGINTDTMILMHIPASGAAASFVSFPRDSYVDIPGHGMDKLNSAYAYGYAAAPEGATETAREAAGAQLLIRTISQLSGLQIDHYAEVDLLGFVNLSTIVGGVEVNLCKAVDDSEFSGAVFPAGVQTITGADALKFVRQRHGLPGGDFDRIVRQQVYLSGVIRNILSQNVLLSPSKQRALVDAAASSVVVDQDLDLLSLAAQLQSVSLGAIDFQTIPSVGDGRDDQGRYILELQDEQVLHTWFANLTASTDAEGGEAPAAPAAPATVAPADVPVGVYNGSGTSGLAAKTSAELTAAGFPVTATASADSQDYTTTEIRYAAGDEALANTLLASVPGAVLSVDDGVESGTVQLVLGSDFNGIGQPVSAPAPAGGVTSTTDERTAADTTCIN